MLLHVDRFKTPDEERFRILDRAWELSATFCDTAQEFGDSVVLVSKWPAKHPKRHQDILLATMFGIPWKVDHGKVRLLRESSSENCLKTCKERLEKLGVDHIDIFYVHRFDDKTPVELANDCRLAFPVPSQATRDYRRSRALPEY